MMNQKQKSEVVSRLNKIEGQIRGIKNMVEEDRYCMDILAQTRAVAAAIKRVEEKIMYQHLQTCVAQSMAGNDEIDKSAKIAEIMELLSKFR